MSTFFNIEKDHIQGIFIYSASYMVFVFTLLTYVNTSLFLKMNIREDGLDGSVSIVFYLGILYISAMIDAV